MKRSTILAALIALTLIAGALFVRTPARKVQCPCTANGAECPCTPNRFGCPCCEPAIPADPNPLVPVPPPDLP